MLARVSGLLRNPLLWRVTGFVSSIVGFLCFALGPSFEDLFGQWNPPKIYIYSVVASLSALGMLFVRRCECRLLNSSLIKAPVAFLVLMLTSLCSYFEDRLGQGEEEKGYGRKMHLASTCAFAWMALSLSRLLQLGFEVGVANFFLGCFLVTLMKMNLKWSPLAAFFCYLLINVRSITEFMEKKTVLPISEHRSPRRISTEGSIRRFPAPTRPHPSPPQPVSPSPRDRRWAKLARAFRFAQKASHR